MEETATKKWDVLLAEDDQEDVLIFELAIAETRILIDLRHAVDGEKLFHLLQEAIPDILFLDINMPCKDGINCIVEIRNNPAYNDLPVVMYTSYRSKEKIDSAYQAGANLYLVKSERITELAHHLKQVFAVNWKEYLYYPPYDDFALGGN